MGVTTRARGRPWVMGSSDSSALVWSRCSRELPNASVFPVPVRAWPIRSVPLRARGMASAWIGNELTIPASASEAVISSQIPRSENVSEVVVSFRVKT